MYLVKTPEGQQAFKERNADLSQRLRSAFLLFDGRRTLMQVLEATSALGVNKDDILALVGRGWLATRESSVVADAAAQVHASSLSKSSSASLAPADVDPGSSQRRYQRAYPIAVSITGSLGLKGFRLNLAVEAASSFEDLAALAPKIKEAVGEAKYEPLRKALFG